MAVYMTNWPFNYYENPCVQEDKRALYPVYKGLNRRQMSGCLLDKSYITMKRKVNAQLDVCDHSECHLRFGFDVSELGIVEAPHPERITYLLFKESLLDKSFLYILPSLLQTQNLRRCSKPNMPGWTSLPIISIIIPRFLPFSHEFSKLHFHTSMIQRQRSQRMTPRDLIQVMASGRSNDG